MVRSIIQARIPKYLFSLLNPITKPLSLWVRDQLLIIQIVNHIVNSKTKLIFLLQLLKIIDPLHHQWLKIIYFISTLHIYCAISWFPSSIM